MKLKITNSETNDFIILEADTIEEIQKKFYESNVGRSKNWDMNNCYSEKLTLKHKGLWKKK